MNFKEFDNILSQNYMHANGAISLMFKLLDSEKQIKVTLKYLNDIFQESFIVDITDFDEFNNILSYIENKYKLVKCKPKLKRINSKSTYGILGSDSHQIEYYDYDQAYKASPGLLLTAGFKNNFTKDIGVAVISASIDNGLLSLDDAILEIHTYNDDMNMRYRYIALYTMPIKQLINIDEYYLLIYGYFKEYINTINKKIKASVREDLVEIIKSKFNHTLENIKIYEERVYEYVNDKDSIDLLKEIKY